MTHRKHPSRTLTALLVLALVLAPAAEAKKKKKPKEGDSAISGTVVLAAWATFALFQSLDQREPQRAVARTISTSCSASATGRSRASAAALASVRAGKDSNTATVHEKTAAATTRSRGSMR